MVCPYLFVALLGGSCITHKRSNLNSDPSFPSSDCVFREGSVAPYLFLVVPAVSGTCSEGAGHSTQLAIGLVELVEVRETRDSFPACLETE